MLIGTNSDDGALFARPGVTAAKASKDVFHDAVFAWPTWTWELAYVFHNLARPLPNLEQLETFERYYAWRREQVKARGAK